MTVIHSGLLECDTPSTAAFPLCSVTCDSFEEEFTTPMETFECGINGTWNKQLEFCVIPKAGIANKLLKLRIMNRGTVLDLGQYHFISRYISSS